MEKKKVESKNEKDVKSSKLTDKKKVDINEEDKQHAKKVKKIEKKSEKKEKVKTHKTAKTSGTKRKRKKKKVVIAKGKRKRAIARAVIKEGTGKLRLNRSSIDSIENKYLKAFIMQPFAFIGTKLSKIDVNVNVKGGGLMGQLQAARTAIARAIVSYFDDDSIEKKMYEYDRYLLGNDTRRVEPKKDRAKKARAKYQKSYR